MGRSLQYLFKLSFLVFIIVFLVNNTFSQTISLFPAIDPSTDYGYRATMIEYNDSLYFRYNTGSDYIAKFNGSSYRLASTGTDIAEFAIVFNGELYYILQGTKGNLGRINSNGTITVIPNPDNAYGFSGQPIEYNGKLYCRYINNSGRSSVAIFDGLTVSLIPQADSGPGFTFAPLVHNGYLYWIYQTITQHYVLGKYDGTNMVLIGNAGTGPGIRSNMTVFNNDLYFNFNDSLGHYNGVSINTIPLPFQATIVNATDLVAHGGRLWFKTVRGVQQFQLGYYDGNIINLFGTTYPYNFGFFNSIVYKDHIYFRMDSLDTRTSMARIDANDITVIPRLYPYDPGNFGSAIIYNNNLYFNYYSQVSGSCVAKYDGTTLSLLPHPPTGNGYYNQNQPPLIYKGSLYFGYSCEQPQLHQELARLTDSILSTTLCPGSNLTFTSSLEANAYQWQLNAGSGYTSITNNSNYSGTNTRNLVISNATSAWYGYTYRCMADGNPSQAYQLQFSNEWTGAINNSWENAGNWSCSVVPDSNTDVIINSGTVILNSDTTIRSFTLATGVSFTVNPGYNLTILH